MAAAEQKPGRVHVSRARSAFFPACEPLLQDWVGHSSFRRRSHYTSAGPRPEKTASCAGEGIRSWGQSSALWGGLPRLPRPRPQEGWRERRKQAFQKAISTRFNPFLAPDHPNSRASVRCESCPLPPARLSVIPKVIGRGLCDVTRFQNTDKEAGRGGRMKAADIITGAD
ncbi:hypothetical protein SKAU_G00242440 [Synaphobranchus kaupii]|uniref:Uncharacterized protein n=1 Tax=Synaphobranchus kaupii TaxID=118154 RepID=A0A9Q1F7X9_SYNKA|nr:hypothetical protein SKAU_G00242440 [Synaphobranchus kaupii]